MFERLKNLFRHKNFASPYYGKGNRPLYDAPRLQMEFQQEPAKQESAPRPQPAKHVNDEPDWEQRRFELVKMLVGQDRRSVVLGKLLARNKQIAANSRHLADAAIKELRNHPLKDSDDDTGRNGTDEPGAERN